MGVSEEPAMPQNGWFCHSIQKKEITSLVDHFAKMAKVKLIHPQQRVEVLYRLLVRKSDLFADDPTLGASSYTLKSRVSLVDFRAFVAALKGKRMRIKKDNFGWLFQLSDEFGFEDLATRLSEFRESPLFKEEVVRLSALEGRMDRLEALIWRVAVPLSALKR
jgi:hypothetical protein